MQTRSDGALGLVAAQNAILEERMRAEMEEREMERARAAQHGEQRTQPVARAEGAAAEEEGRGSGGGADEGNAEEVSLSWALSSGENLPRSAVDRFVDGHVRGLMDQC